MTHQEIARANNIPTSKILHIGERLTIPGTGQAPTVPTPPTTPTVSATHTVARGDNWWTIARTYGVNMNDLARANGKTTANYIYPGQVLKIPGVAPAPTQPTTPTPPAPTQPTPPPAGSRTHTVKRGENWWGIARTYGVNMNDLAAANNKRTSDYIYAGQVLKIPGGTAAPTPAPTPKPETPAQPTPAPTPPPAHRTHTVVRGDNWWTIARTYGVNMNDLAAANNKRTSDYIYAGQVLKIPGGTAAPAPTPKPDTPAQPTPVPTQPPAQRTHTVARGDSWWTIARTYGVNMNELVRLNGKSTSDIIHVGQVLKIPGSGPATGGDTQPTTPQVPANQMTVVSVPTVNDPRMAHQSDRYKIIMSPNTIDGDVHTAGGGLGIAIQTPNGRTIMIDGGHQHMQPGTTTLRTGAGSGELANVKSWLATHAGNHVDAWIMTHPHNDHARVPAAIIHENKVRIDKVYGVLYPKASHDQKVGDETPAQSAFVYDAYAKVKNAGKYTEIQPGSSFELDGVRVEFLNALNLDLYRENDSSAVMRITFAGSDRVVLLLTDIQADGANRLITRYPGKLKADVVQMAHHGLDRLPELYRRIGASVVLLPAGRSMATRSDTQAAVANLKSVAGGTVYDATSPWQMVEIFK